MKGSQKELLISDQIMTTPRNSSSSSSSSTRGLQKLMVWLILFISLTYLVYTLKLVSSSSSNSSCIEQIPTLNHIHHLLNSSSSSISTDNEDEDDGVGITTTISIQNQNQTRSSSNSLIERVEAKTGLKHIVFGIAASSKLWEMRKNYIKLWWKSNEMRGIVWLDKPVKLRGDQSGIPQVKISGDTSRFPYTNRQGHRSAIRISRIVSETLRLGLTNVRWFVMGDDDTFFVAENLVRVLSKYDHNQYYYIGSLSESHLQNIYFSYGMAYGGGGFAISYPLAVALDKIQDRCIHRYPGLYGSDDRMQACMSELGVPLTKELGFHQYDVYGNLFGLLAAHPVAPLVTLHHLDVVEPIFPNVTRVQALQRLMVPMKLDSAGLMQQSICYHKKNRWTVSVSWGYAVQIFRGVFSPREMEMPSRTFLNWYKRADYTAYAFNTRPVARNPCQKPFVFFMANARFDSTLNQTVTEYVKHRTPQPTCKWKMTSPDDIETVLVYKRPDPHLWDKSPRRNCCRILSTNKKGRMVIEVGVCAEGEISEV